MSTISNLTKTALSETITYDQVIPGPTPPVTQTRLITTGGTRTGSAVPNYREKIRNGSNATGTFDATSFELLSKSQYSYRANYGGNKKDWMACSGDYSLTGGYDIDLVISPSVLSLIDNQARIKAYGELRSGFNGYTVIGELRETARMIASPAKSFRKGINQYLKEARTIRHRLKQGRDFRRAIADSWLEYSFGWVPLISDIQSAAAAYRDIVARPHIVDFKGTYRTTQQVPASSTRVQPVQDVLVDIIRACTIEASCSYQGSAHIGLSARSPSFNLGVGLPDFVPAAWELCPWSFLIDYFVNVGDVLDSWATAQYVSMGYTCKTTRLVAKTFVQSKFVRTQATAVVENRVEGYTNWESKKITRRSFSNVPLPSFQVRSKLDSIKGLNIAALIAGRQSDRNYRR